MWILVLKVTVAHGRGNPWYARMCSFDAPINEEVTDFLRLAPPNPKSAAKTKVATEKMRQSALLTYTFVY